MITLSATKRTNENVDEIRANGSIPAVCYGNKKEAFSASVSEKEFTKVFKEAGETSSIQLDFGGEKVPTLVHDLQRDPVTGAVTHIDFMIIDMHKDIEVAVPIEFIGLAQAEKSGLGNLVKVLHEVEVKALPDKMPHSFEIDVTNLATLEDKIHVSDIALPAGVTMLTPGEEVVALIASFVEEKEETPIDLSQIEVVEKGKKDDEEIVAAE